MPEFFRKGVAPQVLLTWYACQIIEGFVGYLLIFLRHFMTACAVNPKRTSFAWRTQSRPLFSALYVKVRSMRVVLIAHLISSR